MGALSFPNDFTAGTTISSSQMNANFTAAETWSTTISDDNFSSSASVYSAYRDYHVSPGAVTSNDLPAGTYWFSPSGSLDSSGSASLATQALTFLGSTDLSISGRTTKLRVRAQVSTNATQPLITFTFGLYPVTFAGGADSLVTTLGTVVAGSTVAIASPAASSTTQGNSGDFSIPVDGLYAFGVVTSAILTNNNKSLLTAQLQQRWT